MTGSISGAIESLTISRGSAGKEATRNRVGIKMYYQDHHITLYNGDCRNMSELPDECVQMVCTSPPYWGLRKYAGVPDLVWGGKDWDKSIGSTATCSICGAWKGSYGLEPTPEMYVQLTIERLRQQGFSL